MDMIAASRKANEEQLRKEGKTPPKNSGMFPASMPSADARRAAKEMYGRSKRPEKYEEVMDHLEEPELSEEELMRIGE